MRILVAGIGNIFMGDDAFGCEVSRALERCELPEGVDVVDFGIRGMDLGYALMDGYEAAILIDTVDRGAPPGTVYVIEPEFDGSRIEDSGRRDSDADQTEGEAPETDANRIVPHAMDPVRVLQFLAALGGRCPRVLLVGCQPEYLGGADGHIGLSEAVTAAVDGAALQVRSILKEWGQPTPRHCSGSVPRWHQDRPPGRLGEA